MATASTIVLTSMFLTSAGARERILEHGVLDYVFEALRNAVTSHLPSVMALFAAVVRSGEARNQMQTGLFALSTISKFLNDHVDELPFSILDASLSVLDDIISMLSEIEHETAAGKRSGIDSAVADKVCDIQLRVYLVLEGSIQSESCIEPALIPAVAHTVNRMMHSLAAVLVALTLRPRLHTKTSLLVDNAARCFVAGTWLVDALGAILADALDKHAFLSDLGCLFDVASLLVRFSTHHCIDEPCQRRIDWTASEFLEVLPMTITRERQWLAPPGALALLVALLDTSNNFNTTFPFQSLVEPLVAAHDMIEVRAQPLVANALRAVVVSSGHLLDTHAAGEHVTFALGGVADASIASIARRAQTLVQSFPISASTSAAPPTATVGALHFLSALLCTRICGSADNSMEPRKLSANESAHLSIFMTYMLETWQRSDVQQHFSARLTSGANHAVYLACQIARRDLKRIPPAVVEKLQQYLTAVTTLEDSQHLSGVALHTGLVVSIGLMMRQRGSMFNALLFDTLGKARSADAAEMASLVSKSRNVMALLLEMNCVGTTPDTGRRSTLSDNGNAARPLLFAQMVLQAVPASKLHNGDVQTFVNWLQQLIGVHRAQHVYDRVVVELAIVQQLIIKFEDSLGCGQLVLDIMQTAFAVASTESTHGGDHFVERCLEFISSTLLVLCGNPEGENRRSSSSSLGEQRRVLANGIASDPVVRAIFVPSLERLLFSADENLGQQAMQCIVALAQFVLHSTSGPRGASTDVRLRLVELLPNICTHDRVQHLVRSSASVPDKLLTMQLFGAYARLSKIELDANQHDEHVQFPLISPRTVYNTVVRFAQTVVIDEGNEVLHTAANKLVFILLAVSRVRWAQTKQPSSASSSSSSSSSSSTSLPPAIATQLTPLHRHQWSVRDVGSVLFGNVWFEFTFRRLLDACHSCAAWPTAALQLLTMYIVATKDATIFSCHVDITDEDQLSIFASLQRLQAQFDHHQDLKQSKAMWAAHTAMLNHAVVFMVLFNSPEHTCPYGLEQRVNQWLTQNEATLRCMLKRRAPNMRSASLPDAQSVQGTADTPSADNTTGAGVESLFPLVLEYCQRWPSNDGLFDHIDEQPSVGASSGRDGLGLPRTTSSLTKPRTAMADASRRQWHNQVTKMRQLLQSLANPASIVDQLMQSHQERAFGMT